MSAAEDLDDERELDRLEKLAHELLREVRALRRRRGPRAPSTPVEGPPPVSDTDRARARAAARRLGLVVHDPEPER